MQNGKRRTCLVIVLLLMTAIVAAAQGGAKTEIQKAVRLNDQGVSQIDRDSLFSLPRVVP